MSNPESPVPALDPQVAKLMDAFLGLPPELRSEFTAASMETHVSPDGFLPLKVFNAYCHLGPLATVEYIGVRDGEEGPDVFLTRRSDSEPWWPGLMHMAGVALLNSDATKVASNLSRPLKRLLTSPKEINGAVRPTQDPELLEIRFMEGTRGVEITPIFWLPATEVPGRLPNRGGGFFNAEIVSQQPPDKIIDVHLPYIALAVEKFRASRSR